VVRTGVQNASTDNQLLRTTPRKTKYREIPVVHHTSRLYICLPGSLKRCLPLPNIYLTFRQWTGLHSQPRDWGIQVLSENKKQPKSRQRKEGCNTHVAQMHAAKNHRLMSYQTKGTHSKEHPHEQISAVFFFFQ